MSDCPSYSSANLRARRTIPVAEATVSKHPDLPQVHSNAVSLISTVTCPISPAAPAVPWMRFPLATIPPPTPVPSVINITSGLFSPAPTQRSPNAATLASLSIVNGKPTPASIAAPTSCNVSQPRL